MVSNIQKGDVIKVENILALKSVKRTINDFGIKFDIVPFLRHFI
jgi:molybdenum cofactor biosynthesis enzyme